MLLKTPVPSREGGSKMERTRKGKKKNKKKLTFNSS
jgi:hypothetical protein